MTIELEYASARTPAAVRRKVMLAVVLPLLSVIVAGMILEHAVDLATRAFYALILPIDCGTGRHAAEYELYFQLPWALAAPFMLVLIAHGFRTGMLVCRCALWASVAGWATAAFVLYCRQQF